MAQKVQAGMPDTLDLDANYTIEWAALDPTSGANVSGVVVSTATLTVSDVNQAGGANLVYGPFMLVPGPGA